MVDCVCLTTTYLMSLSILLGILPYQDPREYFDSQHANALKTLRETGGGTKFVNLILNAKEAYGYLVDQISEVKGGMNGPVIQPEAAIKVAM